MTQAHGFEKAFCDEWAGWDDGGDFAMQFYDAKINVDLGKYKAGDTVPVLILDLERCKIQIFEGGEFPTFEGTLNVVLLDELEALRDKVAKLEKHIYNLETGKYGHT